MMDWIIDELKWKAGISEKAGFVRVFILAVSDPIPLSRKTYKGHSRQLSRPRKTSQKIKRATILAQTKK